MPIKFLVLGGGGVVGFSEGGGVEVPIYIFYGRGFFPNNYPVFANTSLINSKNKISVTVSVTFRKVIPRNYESVTLGQF